MSGVKYTRVTLSAEVAARTGVLREDVSKVMAMAVEVMAEALAGGGEVALQGLGTLFAETKESRQGFDPQAQTPCTIPERRRYKFRAGPALLTRGEQLRQEQREDSEPR